MGHVERTSNLLGLVLTTAIGLLIGIVVPTSANAGTFTETATSGTQFADFSTNLVLNEFNLAGNQLTSVDVTFTAVTSSTATLTNNGSTTELGTFSVSSQLSFAPGAGAPSSFPSNTSTLYPIVTDLFFLGPGAQSSFPSPEIFDSSSTIITTNLSQYVGSGSFDESLSTLTTLFFNAGGENIAADSSTQDSGSITITYNYVPVSTTPLPAAFPLFASGLGAMGLFGWRRKRKNAVTLAAA
jgi:hypothetical protein